MAKPTLAFSGTSPLFSRSIVMAQGSVNETPIADDRGDSTFKWIRAPEEAAQRQRRTRAIAALVLAGACFSIGLALGLVSNRLQTRKAPTSTSVEVANPKDETSAQPTPRNITSTSSPSLALGGDHAGASTAAAGGTNSSAAPPPVILLNPDGRRNDEQPTSESASVRTPEEPGSAERQSPANIRIKPARTNPAGAVPTVAKDYRALRDYVLDR